MAQLSKSAFLSKWASLFADNSTRNISELDLRDFRQDISDSFLSGVDDVYKGYLATAAGTNTYTATASPAITAYASGQRFYILFTNANTGAATLNLNSVGAVSIVKNGGEALVAGDIAAGQALELLYDGSEFQVIGNTNVIDGGTL